MLKFYFLNLFYHLPLQPKTFFLYKKIYYNLKFNLFNIGFEPITFLKEYFLKILRLPFRQLNIIS
jgi:hypothetical protein